MGDDNRLQPPAFVHEKFFAVQLLHATAGKTSEIFDKFSSWLFVGYGGAVTFLITNADKLKTNVPPETLRAAVQVLVPVAVIAIICKYLASIVAGASEGSTAGREIGKRFDDAGIALDIRALFAEFTKPLFQPARWLATRALAKIAQGDLTYGARRIHQIGQVQGFLTVAQAGFILYAIYQLAANVKF